ncbi:kinase-like protein [Heliocybe sulcata]|uniref:Kinase-like protein n=1 Tax=Heliocybe sulcata TaxID=5364 RepID=A0A5C3MP70_9AGAM|nr:kinase-like protein [Heliocybe sulcata]
MQDAPAGTLRTIPGPHGCIHVSHTGTGAPLAMKRFNAVGNEFLHHRALEVSQAVYRWQAVAARQHPNIYPVYGIRNRDSVSFAIDMPYSAEGNLMNYITNNPQTARLALVEQIATGLEYLHRNGLVHGNLKPSNVLMEQERAKLTDIGITAALQLEDLRNPRKTVQLPSDWMYNAADEILRIDLNDPMPVMQGRDVYAFAHTVYEVSLHMCSDDPPFNYPPGSFTLAERI